jgi:uncharacterized repeat protein (TIGR04076 family)
MSEDFWNTKVRMTCEEKLGKCHHEVGDTFVFKHARAYAEGLCSGAWSPARPYLSHCAAGVPSWEADDDSIHRIHCISKKGTVWRLERIEKDES